MVSTRHHPRPFPPPDTPSKSNDETESIGTRSTRSTRDKTRTSMSPGPDSPTTAVAKAASTRSRARASSTGSWTHTPSHLTLVWLIISLPVVMWDTGYVMGRPHTFPGGWLHAPLWTPYALYYEVDYTYGQPAWDSRNGWTSAQGFMNIIETLMYCGYLYMVFKYGNEQVDRRVTRSGKSTTKKVQGRGAPSSKVAGWLGEARVIDGPAAGAATLLGFTAAMLTLNKTILYALIEYFSGWNYIGHNSASTIFFLWVVPNGMWIIVPTYMCYAFGADLIEALTIASGSPVPKAIATKEE